jgi:hypothetical protein
MLIKEAGQDVHRDVGTGESGFHILVRGTCRRITWISLRIRLIEERSPRGGRAMTQSHHSHRRLILLSAEAWAAAQELSEGTGSSPSQFIEIMLFDLRDTIADATPAEDLPVGAFPIRSCVFVAGAARTLSADDDHPATPPGGTRRHVGCWNMDFCR